MVENENYLFDLDSKMGDGDLGLKMNNGRSVDISDMKLPCSFKVRTTIIGFNEEICIPKLAL